jgi:hypothetical protein
MDYTFLDECRRISQTDLQWERKQAHESIVKIIFQLKMRGPEKARQLDEYDGESLFGNVVLLPGQIYAFSYAAKEPSVYDNGKVRFQFYDSLPVLLVTHRNGKNISGINLNLCNSGLRAVIINALHNLDLEFFKRNNMLMAENGQAPYSEKAAGMFASRERESDFLKFITRECKLENPDILYRTYNIERIQDVRLIEIWQHLHIPFLKYYGEIKNDILEAIYKVTG